MANCLIRRGTISEGPLIWSNSNQSPTSYTTTSITLSQSVKEGDIVKIKCRSYNTTYSRYDIGYCYAEVLKTTTSIAGINSLCFGISLPYTYMTTVNSILGIGNTNSVRAFYKSTTSTSSSSFTVTGGIAPWSRTQPISSSAAIVDGGTSYDNRYAMPLKIWKVTNLQF